MDMPHYTTDLLEKNILAPDVMTLRFRRPIGFDFSAGQFIQIHVPTESTDAFRSYSLSSSPADQHIELCAKLLPGGLASEFFRNMNVGDELRFAGPRGQFTFREESDAHIFVATGVGLAPIMGILRDKIEHHVKPAETAGPVGEKKTNKEKRLLFGVRTEDDIFWQDRLDSLQSLSDRFSYHLTLSQPKTGGGWSGLRGHVTDHLLPNLIDHEWYLCGGAGMVKDVRQQLLANGVAKERVHFEIF